ncbi:hypothetical protein VKT23_000405 [Stygiomarasmius scandens]|uniref:F-box domain-containing protein n=1 Tax=Marasmiellus scandens TaxID=2682957 RepID=A0ABR1K6G9_9AGAR
MHRDIEEGTLAEAIKAYNSILSRLGSEREDIQRKLKAIHGSERVFQQAVLRSDSLKTIAELETALSLLIEEERAMETLLKDHKSLLSPIRRVPSEIWMQVFIQCLPDTEYIAWRPDFPPFILMSVCSHWRNLVMTTSQLWASLSIHILPKSDWRKLLNVFSSRSGQLPLNLAVQWYPSRFHREQEPFEAYIPELATSSHRWRSLQLSVPETSLRLLFDHALPQLEVLELCSQASARSWAHIRAPNLCKLTFSSVYVGVPSQSLSWPHLNEFNSRSPLMIHEVLAIFSSCPSMQRCCIHVHGEPHGLGSDPVRIARMPRLESIALVCTRSAPHILHFFDALDTPVLHSVELTSPAGIHAPPSHRPVLWPKPYLLRLTDRSGCRIRKLVFKGTVSHDLENRDIVKRLVDLREMEIWHGEEDVVPDDLKNLLNQRLREDEELRRLDDKMAILTTCSAETGGNPAREIGTEDEELDGDWNIL